MCDNPSAPDLALSSPAAESPSAGNISQWLQAKLGELLECPADSIPVNKPLSTLGLDSVMAACVLGELETYLDRPLPESTITAQISIEALAGALSTPSSQAEPSEIDRSDRYCIIGAGPSGLAAAKNLLALGIACDVIEAHSDLGGIWDIKNPSSTVYQSTHTITSRSVTAYTDFPIPKEYPVYMHHSLVLKYLRDYAEHFGLRRHIQFCTRVKKVERRGEGGWKVRLEGDPSPRHYKGVILANGHNWCPKLPQYPGEFTGVSFHSKEYKSPENLGGKRVLVVGSGNTGCDIAVEASRVAATVFLSARRGYYYLPKFLLGMPSDALGQSSQGLRLPMWLIRTFYKILLRLTVGDQTQYGLPKPDHEVLETPPIANSLLPYYVAHGMVKMRPDIARFEGRGVKFIDGGIEEIDCVIYATGYQPSFPFIGQEHLAWKDKKPQPYLFLFHPEYDDLFFAGLTDGTGGHFPTVDYGTQLLARYVWALESDREGAAAFRQLIQGPPPNLARGITFIDTPRNYTQFELNYYTQLLRRHIGEFSRRAKKLRRFPALSTQSAPKPE